MRTLLACVLVGAAMPGEARPGDEDEERDVKAREYRAKAELLHKVQRYVQWPAARLAEEEPFVIGVYGQDPFGGALEETFAGKVHDGHPFRIQRQWHLEGLEQCHVLFVPRTELAALEVLVERVRGEGVMLVGEADGFASRGGVVNFVPDDEGRLVLEINVDAAKREGLSVRSTLLKVARIVRDGEEKEGA